MLELDNLVASGRTKRTLLCMSTPSRTDLQSRRTSCGNESAFHHRAWKQMVPAAWASVLANTQERGGGVGTTHIAPPFTTYDRLARGKVYAAVFLDDGHGIVCRCAIFAPAS